MNPLNFVIINKKLTKMSSMTRTDILSQIQIYEGYKTDAKKRGEYDVAAWYEKTLVELKQKLSSTK